MSNQYWRIVTLVFLIIIMLGLTCLPGCVPDASGTTQPAPTGPDATEPLVWPADAMAGLPAPEARITAITHDTDSKSSTVLFSDMSPEQIVSYIEQVEAAGYTRTDLMTDESGFSYSAGNEQAQVFLLFDRELNEGIIILTISGPETDLEPSVLVWPSEQWPELTQPAGQITEIIQYNDSDMTLYLIQIERREAEHFLEEVRLLFVLDVTEQSSETSILFMGDNADGDSLGFHWADDLTATIELVRWRADLSDD